MTDFNKQMEMVLYHSDEGDISVDAYIAADSIWVSQKGMAEIFGVGIPAISKHLKNIFNEIESEYGYPIPESGCLESWAKQGVFLLNTVLTVEEGNANSHSKCGWQTFTDNVISILNQENHHIVFLLWGKQAELKRELIDNPNHLVLTSSHPSPFSARRGFFGCNHFKLANEFLKENNLEEIDWRINNSSKGQQTLFK